MRRFLKFLHTMGAMGLIGSMASLLILLNFCRSSRSIADEAALLAAMGGIATWILLPSIALTLVAGLLAIGANPALYDAGWAWAKAATGILMFEGGFVYVVGPIQEGAKRSAGALAGQLDPAMITRSFAAERNTMWVLLAVAIVNVAVGIWRPRFSRSAS